MSQGTGPKGGGGSGSPVDLGNPLGGGVSLPRQDATIPGEADFNYGNQHYSDAELARMLAFSQNWDVSLPPVPEDPGLPGGPANPGTGGGDGGGGIDTGTDAGSPFGYGETGAGSNPAPGPAPAPTS